MGGVAGDTIGGLMAFDPETPHYADSNGSAVHIGDYVYYVTRGSNGAATKSGRVEQINFKEESTTVKVRGRNQNIHASDTTLIGDTTLEDILRKLVATSSGLVKEEDISAAAETIRAGQYE